MNCKPKPDASHYITKDMYHAILKLILLTTIKEKKTYSYKMLKDVGEIVKSRHFPHSGSIKNDIYNTISALENAGYVRVQAKLEGNRVKKYYSITAKGTAALKESRVVFSQAVRSVNGILSK